MRFMSRGPWIKCLVKAERVRFREDRDTAGHAPLAWKVQSKRRLAKEMKSLHRQGLGPGIHPSWTSKQDISHGLHEGDIGVVRNG